MTDFIKELAEFTHQTALDLGPDKAEFELAKHLHHISWLLQEIEWVFKALAEGDMSQGDWKKFTMALFEFAEGPDVHAECLYEDAAEDGVEKFRENRYKAIDQIRTELKLVLG